MDIALPDGDGIAALASIKQINPSSRVVMLTGSTDEMILLRCIEEGCAGFITKDRPASEVIEAVQAALAGEPIISPALMARLIPRLRARDPGAKRGLTRREGEILGYLAAGTTAQEIADEQHLSLHTVRNHIRNVLTKLDAHSQLEAVAIAAREGIIDRR